MSRGVQRFVSEFERVRPRLAGADLPWVVAFRERAMQEFARHGLPSTRLEAWRYTGSSAVGESDFHVAQSAPPAELGGAVERLAIEQSAARLVFFDGRMVNSLSVLPKRDDLLLQSLFSETSGARQRVESEPLSLPADRSLVALNAAMAPESWLLRASSGFRAGEPVQLIFIASSAEPDSANFPRVKIEVEKGALLSIFECHAGLGTGEHLTNAVTRLSLGEGSSLEYVRYQAEPPRARHLGWIEASLETDAALRATCVSLGAGRSRVEVIARLEGARAQADVNGLYSARGEQQVDHQITIDHAHSDGKSHQRFRGILDDKARGILSSKVIVRPDAQKSDSEQSTRSLLLSESAESDAKPQLEIYADDVKCSHGAAVGRIDPAAIFYLRSRGIDEIEARRLLTVAFSDEIVDEIAQTSVRERVRRDVAQWTRAGVTL